VEIREFQKSDAHDLWKLQFQTIRDFCIRDYSLEQLEVWAPEKYEPDVWLKRISGIKPFVAIVNDRTAGYADLQEDGYIDHFYCAKAFIGKGVGGQLMSHILALAQERKIYRLYSHVSITAKPFFERYGFNVVKPQLVNVSGVDLRNFVMERLDTRS
jgi:putative acetyltransferase